MKKYILALMFSVICLLGTVSCTKQQMARNFGGTVTIKVEPGQRVVMATWKNDDLFYMLEPMPEDYTPTNKRLIESSSFGVLESVIIFEESR